MSTRSVHVIHGECDIYVGREAGQVRVRIREKNPELVNPTDFEVEGEAKHIAEAFATIATLLADTKWFDKDPN